jgi:hypothetical protein
MYLVLFLFSVLPLAWSQSSSPVVDPNKFTICTMTINSPDEKKIFQAQAAKNPAKFNPVVELTQMGNDSDWFSKACTSGIRCDQLVISGHFAGDFFGKSGKSLSLKELETASCSKSCEGILNQPYEVFLFGCNTLSGKEGDSRTPAQYLQVLLSDGIPLAQAELVVQSRYGAVGDSHKASMQRAFGGELKQLYGFDSVGPSGANVKGFINNYFSKVSAAGQLEKQQAKRMMNKVEMTNKALAESLKSTAFTQCASVDTNDEKMKKVCGLLDARKNVGDKLDLTIELLGQEDYLVYLPAISNFMAEIEYNRLSEEDKKAFDLIKNNNVIKQQLLALIDKTDGLGLKSEWIMLAKNMGFISKEEVTLRLSAEVEKKFSKPLSDNDVEMLCSLDDTSFIKISDKNLKNRSLGPRELQAFSCLAYSIDSALVNRIINTKMVGPEALSSQFYIAYASTDRNLNIPTALEAYAKKELTSTNVYNAGEALEFLSKFRPQDPLALEFARKFINDPKKDEDKLRFGLSALEALNTKNVAALNDVLRIAKSEPDYSYQSISILVRAKSEDKAVQLGIAELLNNSKLTQYDKLSVLNYLRELKSAEPAAQQELLKYVRDNSNYYHTEAMQILKNSVLSPEVQTEVDKLK